MRLSVAPFPHVWHLWKRKGTLSLTHRSHDKYIYRCHRERQQDRVRLCLCVVPPQSPPCLDDGYSNQGGSHLLPHFLCPSHNWWQAHSVLMGCHCRFALSGTLLVPPFWCASHRERQTRWCGLRAARSWLMCYVLTGGGPVFSWPPLLHCLLQGASFNSCLFLVCYLQTGHLALSLSGYLWMVLAGRRGMCAHSGYFKICQCALVGLVEQFCHGCHPGNYQPSVCQWPDFPYAALHQLKTHCISGLALLCLPLHC